MSGDPSDDFVPDKALVKRVRKILKRESQTYLERRAAPYDGVKGELPEWVPEWHQREFFRLRNKLLDSQYVTPGQVLTWLDIFTESGEGAESQRTRPIPPEHFDAVGQLAHYRWAVSLGSERGLESLIDKNIAKQAITGKKFHEGRKPNTIRPVRKFIRAELKQNPNAKNQEIWISLKSRPPKGWAVRETSRIGLYIEGPKTSDNVGWRRFCNIAADERKLLLKFTG